MHHVSGIFIIIGPDAFIIRWSQPIMIMSWAFFCDVIDLNHIATYFN